MKTTPYPHLRRLGLLLVALLYVAPLRAEHMLESTFDLQESSLEAAQQHVPLLIMFSADYCSYCRKLEHLYLYRLIEDPDYSRKIMIRKILVDNPMPITDFDGEDIEAYDVAMRYGVEYTPTLIFVSCSGEELADKLVGAGTVSNYWETLIQSIDTAHTKLECNN